MCKEPFASPYQREGVNFSCTSVRIEPAMNSAEIFKSSLRWLQDSYFDHKFYTERDIVWTIQKHISDEIKRAGLPYRVFNDHTIFRKTRTDLAILDEKNSVEIAAEFKYEPSHTRRADRGGDIWQTKFDVVFWSGEGSVEKDVQRVKEYVARGLVKEAFAVFLDEGGHFRHRTPHPGSKWIDWGQGVSVLWAHHVFQ